jgi:hypothetical protein
MHAGPIESMFFLLLYYANAMIILYYSGNFTPYTDNIKLLFLPWYSPYALVRSLAGISWKLPGRVTVYPPIHRGRGRGR